MQRKMIVVFSNKWWPTTAKVAQKIVSKDNPDSFVLGDALGANISGVITSAIITGIYITIIPYL